ncbi:MAG: non-canonical purine NTP pyrophosphatase, partial [Coriobacteriaceae bacterium]|nr:non-canonical purine NTP pyrophosphatase [Coriobacteriaceae bacterium]
MAAKKVVIATNNAHKLEEISRILAPLSWEFVSLGSCGQFPEPVEDADTFEGNARIKALAGLENTGLPALADDSGLEVDALDGRPGVYSSRYAGEDATDEENNDKLLGELADVP